MKLKFRINYHTSWGIHLEVKICYCNADGSVVNRASIPMNTEDGEAWIVETTLVESRQRSIAYVTYLYTVCGEEGIVLRTEWNLIPRRYHIDVTKNYEMMDSWRDVPLQYHLYTKAYATAKGNDEKKEFDSLVFPMFRKTVVFRVSAPQLEKNDMLAVVGSHPIVGCWNAARYMAMTYCGQSEWMLSINVDNVLEPIEYKYVVIDADKHALKEWEGGDNRTVDHRSFEDGKVLVMYDGTLRVSEKKWKAAGVVIPVFSLRSEHSYGVGDFGDLRRFVDWVSLVGMHAIQVLPVNDTTMTRHHSDSYPYNAISIYALHPHYINLEELGELKDKEKMTSFYRQRQELNAIDGSDYEAVDRVKWAYLRAVFAEKGKRTLASHDYQSFYENNKHWLMPYSVFCVLRDRYETAHFADWKLLSVYNQQTVERLCAEDSEIYQMVLFVYYVQYHLHRQLKEATDYARSKGVFVKGDLPIGISRDSVEAWMEPQFFNMNFQTGAPPDPFSYFGQNWGFPTYNWTEMYKDNCQWWRQRFANMQQYFDAFRIDHVLGFFRIWEIPANAVHGLLGHFSPSLPLSVGEIGYYGLAFRKELFTHPFINDDVLQRYFGIHAAYVREHFLISKSYGIYDLQPAFDTQVKVRDFFVGRTDENSVWIRDGLYRLISNVLFVEDEEQSEMYHPRIGVYSEPVYKALNADEKDAFMRLYNYYFYERHNDYWRNEAMRKLPLMLNETQMLVCGEDLGMLPDCVESTLDTLRILTLEVQSMPKHSGSEFAHLDEYPYRSVATISTHDMSPLRLWWEENPDRAQRYYTVMLQKLGKAPQHLPAWIAEEIVARHLYCPSMLCMLSFQDWTSIDSELRAKDVRMERINVPSDAYNDWRYRMHLTIEELMKAHKWNDKLKQMIKLSQR